jgi:hypothetical protein
MYQLNPGNLPLNVRASHLYISKLKSSYLVSLDHHGKTKTVEYRWNIHIYLFHSILISVITLFHDHYVNV